MPLSRYLFQLFQTHAYHLSMDEVMTIQRVLKHKGVTCTPEDVSTIRSKSDNTVSCDGWG